MPPDPTRTALIAKLRELIADWRSEAKACGYPEIFSVFGECADQLEAASLLAGEGLTQEKEGCDCTRHVHCPRCKGVQVEPLGRGRSCLECGYRE